MRSIEEENVVRICGFILPALAAGVLLAQGEYPPGDVESGGQFFRASCAVCHGPEGTSVHGVDLAHGKFKRASTDEEVVRIIKQGIPGTSMPANDDISAFEAANIIAYLHSLASGAAGSAPVS